LQQFSSPLRLAQIEQQWKTCTQKSDESINEFLVRLRSLWSEHKPRETERDLVRHLFTKVRRELIPLIGVLTEPTLDNFMERAREAEVIEFSRYNQALQNGKSQSNSPSSFITPNRSNPPNTARPNVICYNCHNPGHSASKCSRNESARNPYNQKN